MSNFDPFLRADTDTAAFPVAIEAAIVEAVGGAGGRELPEFDTFGLTPLGFTVADELARVIAESDESFMGIHPSANPGVPKWVKRGNAFFYGNFAEDFEGRVFDPFRELVMPQDEEAITIAKNCMNNGAGAVMDANLVARSILQMPKVAASDEPERVETLRRSHGLAARLAMLNDMEPGVPGRGAFNKFVGIESPMTGAINPEHLELDPDSGEVDLTKEAREFAKDCGVEGRGCPALRKQVEYRGRIIPMIESFWDGSVDVIARR